MPHQEAVFAALTQLDPAPHTPVAENDVDARLALIIAVPRATGSVGRGRPGVSPGPGALPHHLSRSRSLGLAASAAIAVAASLLWVSPSAGAPSPHGVAASVGTAAGGDHTAVAAGGPVTFP
jgi:hypothetical protein